jgi:hypothetical protein
MPASLRTLLSAKDQADWRVFAGLGPVLASVGRLLTIAAFCRNGLSEQIALFVANVS